ncbi:MAG TPA: AMP-binding protein [Xanthobacteraceae bacterium]|nr:AMP-binding protein [Xanthobacteraceae bacterium]
MKASESLDAVREARLRRTLDAVAAAHPFYCARWREAGIDPQKIRTLDDLQALPLTSKQDYIADPEKFRLRADDLPADFSAEERVLWDVAYTSGTTSGKPSPFYNTTHDVYGVMDQARRCNDAEGLVASDRVANLYPLANFPTGAFLSVVRSTTILGLPLVNGLTGAANSEFKVRNSLAEAIEKVERLRPTVLWGVPSFVRRLLDEAQRRGADFSDVRLVITSGEPVPAAMREEMRQQLTRLGAQDVEFRARYAFTEMQGGLVQCAEHAAVQNICPDLYFLEVIDADTGRRLPDGDPGMLAITHLHRRGTVLLRYLVGDVVALSREPCPLCGRVGERVVMTPRRTGNLVKCRGMLVNTDLILDTVSAIEGVSAFQVVFQREERPGGMDQLVIRIERNESAQIRRTDQALRDEVVRRVREAVSMRPEVSFAPRGALYDHEQSIKAKRVIDLRTPE